MRNFITATSMITIGLAPFSAYADSQGPTAAQAQAAAQNGAPAAPDTAPADPRAAEKAGKLAAKIEAKRQADLRAKYGDGPFPDEIASYSEVKPEPLKPLYRALYTNGERNAVLNFERLGLAAFEAGLFKDASWALDQALARIEAVYADNPQAAAARSAFHNEANKDFKGEPYERAMAYYYRGLLYLRDGDYGNARASFKSAEYQDTLSDSETFQSDFAVMNYLVGWTQRCDGQASSAKESFELAAKGEKGLVAPADGDNVLFLAELGNGPVKARDGTQAQKLLFQTGAPYDENSATVTLADGTKTSNIKLMQASSVSYQALTRGGRAIDGLMNGKANWKEGTDAAGTAAMMSGSQMMNTNANAGMGMMGAGLMLSILSSAMKTKADIRAWDGLPDLIMVGSTRATTPAWTYKVSYTKGEQAVDVKGTAMRGDAKGCSVVWMRSRPATYSEAIVGEDANVAAAQSRKKPVAEKNKQFRATLQGAKL